MNVNPPGGTPPGASSPQEDQEPQYQVPPKEQFPRKLQGEEEEKGEQKPKKPTRKKSKQGQHHAKKLISPMALVGHGPDVGAVAGRAAEATGGSGGSAIDRIVHVFENNQLFGAGGVTNVSITERADSSVIGVTLENGVEVNISLSAGQELNITIAGLTAAAQAQADNIENQMLMREKLAEQGFMVHQIQTFRGEGATGGPPPAPPASEAWPRQGGNREQGGSSQENTQDEEEPH